MGATNLNEDAQDSQAQRALRSLTEAVVGIRIVMHDVELRGEGIESFHLSPLPPPRGSDPSSPTPTPTGLALSSMCDFSSFQTLLSLVPMLPVATC